MSGGGGGGSWALDNEISCSKLRFSTQIATPQVGAIQTLKMGDVLDVQVVNVSGAHAVAIFKQNNLIGGLAGGLVNRLRECLLGGSVFKATVTTINGGQITLDIEPI